MFSFEAMSLRLSFVTLDLYVHGLAARILYVYGKKRGLTVIYRLEMRLTS